MFIAFPISELFSTSIESHKPRIFTTLRELSDWLLGCMCGPGHRNYRMTHYRVRAKQDAVRHDFIHYVVPTDRESLEDAIESPDFEFIQYHDFTSPAKELCVIRVMKLELPSSVMLSTVSTSTWDETLPLPEIYISEVFDPLSLAGPK